MGNNIKYPKELDFVHQIIDGNVKAWNRFVQRYSDRIWRCAWELCREVCRKTYHNLFCVFHALAANGVQPREDERLSCDDGLEIYTFIFDYLYDRQHGTGKLKFYDGRSQLDTFVTVVLREHLRDDWIRHKRHLRVDQITRPQEIKKLSATEQKIFDQMVLQRSLEIIAKNLNLSIDKVETAQERIAHELMLHDHLHLILRHPEQALDEDFNREDSGVYYIFPMHRAFDELWGKICLLISQLPENEKILLDMAFNQELNADLILQHCKEMSLKLPVLPRSGRLTIHSIYQSIDAVLKKLGEMLQQKYQQVLIECYNYIDDETIQIGNGISIRGLKELLKNMGIEKKQQTIKNSHQIANSN